MDRIFVLVPSYRDAESPWTIKDLFAKAAHPERIFVGLSMQYDPLKDGACFSVPFTHPSNVRSLHYHWRESQGASWARHKASTLWKGEEYVLSIDSHIRFVEHWDELLIAELAACQSTKPILSAIPAEYTPPDVRATNAPPTVTRAVGYFDDGNIAFAPLALSRTPEHPLRGAFVTSSFLFAKSGLLKDVPFDPYLYFGEDEMTLSARLFTAGYDLFHPRRNLIYHFARRAGTAGYALHWQDLPAIAPIRDRAHQRRDHLLGRATSVDPLILRELNTYGMGSTRSLSDFEAFSGINFAQRSLSQRAIHADFVTDIASYLAGPIEAYQLAQHPKPRVDIADLPIQQQSSTTVTAPTIQQPITQAGGGNVITGIGEIPPHLLAQYPQLQQILPYLQNPQALTPQVRDVAMRIIAHIKQQQNAQAVGGHVAPNNPTPQQIVAQPTQPLTPSEREELNRLRIVAKQLLLERELLARATSWFAREWSNRTPDKPC